MNDESVSPRLLAPWDAEFYLKDRLAYGNSGMVGVGVLAAAESAVEVLEYLRDSLASVEPLTLRLRSAALDLIAPHWESNPSFSFENHLFHQDLGGSGDEGDLAAIVDRLQSSRFDPHHSPWRVTYVTGLTEGRAGVVYQFHHCLADGKTALGWITGASSSEDSLTPSLVEPDSRSMHRATIAATMRHSRTTFPAKPALRSEVSALRRITSTRLPPAAQRTRRRCSIFVTIPLQDFKDSASDLNGGINELLIAIAAQSHGIKHNDTKSVRLAMPVDVRSSTSMGGNAIAVAHLELDRPGSALRRLDEIAISAADGALAAGRNSSATVVEAAIQLLPGPIRARAAYRRSSGAEVVATNLRLPTDVKLGSRSLDRFHIFAPPSGSDATWALLSYRNSVQIGINADPGMAGDVDSLVDALRETLREARLDAVVDRSFAH